MANTKQEMTYDDLLEAVKTCEPRDVLMLYIESQTGNDVEIAEYYPELEDQINNCSDTIAELVDKVKAKAVVQNLKGTLGTE